MHRHHHLLAFGASVAVLAIAATPATAQSQTLSFDIPAQDLSVALRAYGQQARKQVTFDGGVVRGKTSHAVSGAYTADAALTQLLAGTGLQVRLAGDVLIVEVAPRPQDGAAGEPAVVDAVEVTGSRIRGSAPIAPLITRSREDLRAQGRTSLADAIVDIPQNFGGGQNPAVNLAVPSASGVNVNSASSINLRGLGSDATLTLLNGHRLSYSASRQSIDISAIPFEALERIEVVADGSSALYGSDAVGGVANILLRKPYDGGSASARFAASPRGGGGSQLYDLGLGHTWSSGGLMFAAEYGRQEPLWSQDRKATASRPGVTVYPELEKFNAILSGRQALTSSITLELDAMYNHRNSYTVQPADTTARPYVAGYSYPSTNDAYAIAPTLRFALPGDWSAALTMAYAVDTGYFINRSYSNSVRLDSFNCYCNTSTQAEATADGSLFNLPAGPVKAALGAGYRHSTFNVKRSIRPFNQDQEDRYAYGELSVPLVSEAQNLRFVKRLTLSAAARYEDYIDIDKVVTPKIGLLYAPTATLELKGTWGRSFKAPTLFQQYNSRSLYTYPVTSVGGTGYSTTATAVVLLGGNPDLKPERAQSWTAGLAWRPSKTPGLKFELSYFNVDFQDRIVTPIPSTSQALTNPLYAHLVVYAPTATQLQAAYDSSVNFVSIGSAGAYDPTRVVVLINNRSTNAAAQHIQGLDASVKWAVASRLPGTLDLSADATYIDSDQTLIAGAVPTPMSGTIFNPPTYRANASAVWRGDRLTLAGSLNYIGGVEDRRTLPYVNVHGQTTLDTNLTYRAPDGGPLRGVELSAGVQNIFDAMPGMTRTTLPYDTPYDSTNYSVMGRMITVAIRKSW
jgi:outer membrane receptor protein involved in Fe transport